MKIETRDFGLLDINPEEMITFRAAIFGFERLTKFALLYDDTMESPFSWLQSVEERDVCFILVEPETAGIAGYAPALPEGTEQLLSLDGEQPPIFRVIAVIPERFEDATVNLKSPIVINPARKCAAQVIVDAELPIRARLIPEKGGGALC